MVKQFDVSIPAAAGKIHQNMMYRIVAGTSFQFPQLRVRYIERGVVMSIKQMFQFPQLRVRYMKRALIARSERMFQFPQLRVRYIAKITKAHCISAAQFVQLSVFASFIIEEV